MELETRNKLKDLWPLVVLLIGLVIQGGIFFRNRASETVVAKNHIAVVMATDRNCNDCHLGASFVNLFNNEAVKNNDNVVLSIMDKAHIKRW
jgi:hypothetical protein